VDRLLRRELQAVARDRKSGASELALRAIVALQTWLGRYPDPSERHLLEIARALLHAQPSMAPVLRLANVVALSVDATSRGRFLGRSVANLAGLLDTKNKTIGEQFIKAIRRGHKPKVATYSYSSTVLAALRRAASQIDSVVCSEARPGKEGRTTAARLAKAGIEVRFESDVTLLSELMLADGVVVLGVDAVLRSGFVNKVGTSPLVSLALRAGNPVWVLTDTSKFWPESAYRSRYWEWTSGSSRQMWAGHPKGIRVANPYFDVTPFHKQILFLTEQGWMNSLQVRGALKKIKLSPHLRALAD
jgi:translation initiation factor 2B subunit (eIF-2B alpha/beta/delta family)